MIYFFYKVYKGKLLRVDHFIAGDEEEPARKHFIHCRKQSNFEASTNTGRLAKSGLLFKFEDSVPLSCQDEHRALGDEDPDSGVSEGEGLGDRGTASISLKSSSSGLHCDQEDSGG